MKLSEVKNETGWSDKLLNNRDHINEFLKALGAWDNKIDPKTLEITIETSLYMGNKDWFSLPPLNILRVRGDFNCSVNKLKTLDYLPKIIDKSLIMNNNRIKSLHNIHKHVTYIGEYLLVDPYVTHILGVFFIKGLDHVGFRNRATTFLKKERIVNTHLKRGDLHACQEELIEAGLGECAKL